jgi:hypothetical protein
MAAELSERTAEAAKLRADIKQLIEQQLPMQEVVRDLVQQCKQAQEENAMNIAEREELLVKLQTYDSGESTEMAELMDEVQEQRQLTSDLKRRLAATEDALRVAKENEASSNRLQEALVTKNSEYQEQVYVFEANIADLKDERVQLREESQRVAKALDRMKWPPGTAPPTERSSVNSSSARLTSHTSLPPPTVGFAAPLPTPTNRSAAPPPDADPFTHPHHTQFGGDSGGPKVSQAKPSPTPQLSSSMPSVLVFPRAPHANTESDFNIFTGEPRNRGKVVDVQRHHNHPTTRMSWASPGSSQEWTRSSGASGNVNLGLKAPKRYPAYPDKSFEIAYPAGLTSYGNAHLGKDTADHLGSGMVPLQPGLFAPTPALAQATQPNSAVERMQIQNSTLHSTPPRGRPHPLSKENRTDVVLPANNVPATAAAVHASALSRTANDPLIVSLLESSMREKGHERSQLETDLSEGNYDTNAQINGAKRILELDKQILSLQARLADA